MPGPDPTQPIAVLDSGVGGLTVLHECLVSLPHEDFVYLGDTARFPYGERSPGEVRELSLQLAEVLVAEGAKLLLVACSSATSAALPAMREAFGDRLPVVGMIEHESRRAAGLSENGRIGVLATPVTIASGSYERAVRAAAPQATVVAVGCPELAPFIQGGREVDERLVALVDGYCAPLREAGVDTVIYGCTHYPLARALLQRALGRSVQLVSYEAVADEVRRALDATGATRPAGRVGSYRFLCSGDPHEFRRLGTRFLQLPIGDVRQVAIAPARAVGSPA
jgi:glutamate racemase